MAGTIEGGKHAAETNKKLYGADFYARIGAMGGKKGNTGGFHSAMHPNGCSWNPRAHKVAECAGYKGGVISRRTKVAN
jgi:hypothetical protein